jgi:hypothetical protein
MVLKAVVVSMLRAEEASECLQTVHVQENDVSAEVSGKEALNPECGGDMDEERCQTHPSINPTKQRQHANTVYRVTALPLDAYSEAAKNRMKMQDELWRLKKMKRNELEQGINRKTGLVSLSDYVKGWWRRGCCCTGWFGFV